MSEAMTVVWDDVDNLKVMHALMNWHHVTDKMIDSIASQIPSADHEYRRTLEIQLSILTTLKNAVEQEILDRDKPNDPPPE
jgi:frataxin-like iron-binding protein CyaY